MQMPVKNRCTVSIANGVMHVSSYSGQMYALEDDLQHVPCESQFLITVLRDS